MPSRASAASMLPPKLPGHRPPNASAPAGATAMRPSMGLSGISIDFDAEFGRSRTPMLRGRSSRQTKRRAGSGSLIIRVRESPATALIPVGLTADTAVSRFGTQPHDPDDERVVGRRAFDEERADLAGPRPARPSRSSRRPREGARLDDRARTQAQHRRPDGKRRNAVRGLELDAVAEVADLTGSPTRPKAGGVNVLRAGARA